MVWRPCPKPTKIKLDMKTNLETKVVTKHYLPETGIHFFCLFILDFSIRFDFSSRNSNAIGYSVRH